MLFSKKIIRSFTDLPNHTSLVIHSIGCNLKCYKCFNYDSLVANPKDVCDKNGVLSQIKSNGYLSDALIISGGEYLSNDVNEVKFFLCEIREIYDGLVIINTNGSYPEKMKIINPLVDGFHTDMKLPYYLLNLSDDKEIIKQTLGKIIDTEKLLESVDYTVRTDKGFSQIRSVKYPFIDQSVFDDNRNYIDKLNKKYNKTTPYYTNEFVEDGV